MHAQAPKTSESRYLLILYLAKTELTRKPDPNPPKVLDFEHDFHDPNLK